MPKKIPLVLILLASCVCNLFAQNSPPADFLQQRGDELFMDGKPFREISFNKFELVLQLLADQEGRKGFGSQPGLAAEKSLRELSECGFKTIRTFAFCGSGSVFFDPVRKQKYMAALDKALDLCDQYELRVVFCLNVTETHFWMSQNETLLDLVTNAQSKSRQMAEQMVREIVTKYKHRKTIAAWENENELLLMAGIGGVTKTWNGMKIPTLPEVAQFHREMAEFIKKIDPLHLVTTGDSYRESTWHLWKAPLREVKNGWGKDSPEQLAEAVGMAQQGVDLYCIHYYLNEQSHQQVMFLKDWKSVAKKKGKPLYVGELGVLAKSKKDTNFWKKNPDWFESYTGEGRQNTQKYLKILMDEVVESKADLVHWWTFQSDRDMDQNDPQRFDISPDWTPELFQIIVDANRKLQ